jgi:hypothetical protein
MFIVSLITRIAEVSDRWTCFVRRSTFLLSQEIQQK